MERIKEEWRGAGMVAGMVRETAQPSCTARDKEGEGHYHKREKHNPGLPPRTPDLRWWMTGAKRGGGWEGSNLDGPQDERWHGSTGHTTAWWL